MIHPDAPPSREALAARYRAVRATTARLCEPLELEDYVVQSMPDASPAKWHLAHTTWFFEAFVLLRSKPGYAVFADRYGYLFNSYYEAEGERHPRARRGMLTRPTVAEVRRYRAHVDAHLLDLLDHADAARLAAAAAVIELGLHHEQQHQELLLTDLAHAFAENPLRPAYGAPARAAEAPAPPSLWVSVPAGLRAIGHDGHGFAFDNEAPRHPVYVGAFRIATRPVTNREYLAFVEDGGYRRAGLWLSDGWAAVREQGWGAPLYWDERGAVSMTLGGARAIDPEEPVSHLSCYEADAYARWAGARLPTEAEWEVASEGASTGGNFVESGRLHPAAAPQGGKVQPAQMLGDVWEWTRSAYAPYPGFAPLEGALGEYNGKFMCGQMVLRGGSCLTPESHVRRTYRNFFPPGARWQMTGLRLAKDA